MRKVLATAISIAATRDEIRAINLAASLRGINTSDLVREAVYAFYEKEIREAEILLAQRQPQKNHSSRTESA
jgi:uncharacterized protein (DUF1778 family)